MTRSQKELVEEILDKAKALVSIEFFVLCGFLMEAVTAGLSNGNLKYLADQFSKMSDIPSSVFAAEIQDLKNTVSTGAILSGSLETAQYGLDTLRVENDRVICADGTIYVFNSSPDEEKDIGIYSRVSDEELESWLLNLHQGRSVATRQKNVSEQIKLIKRLATDAAFFGDAWAGVALRNGFLYLDQDGKPNLVAHSADHKARFSLDFDYDSDARAPTFTAALERVFPDSQAQEAFLQFLGAMIARVQAWADRHRRGLIIKGPAGSGKSTLLNIAAMFASPSALAHVPLSDFGKENSRAGLAGAQMNVVHELGMSQLREDDQNEHIKKVLAGEPVMGRLKYQDEFTFVCTALHFFATNMLPHVGVNNEAFGRRFLVLQAGRPLAADEMSADFMEVMRAERPGILNLALAAAGRLVRAGSYTLPAAHMAAMEEMRFGGDIEALFAHRYIRAQAGGRILPAVLWARLRRFAKEQGHDLDGATSSAHLKKLYGWIRRLGGDTGSSHNAHRYSRDVILIDDEEPSPTASTLAGPQDGPDMSTADEADQELAAL